MLPPSFPAVCRHGHSSAAPRAMHTARQTRSSATYFFALFLQLSTFNFQPLTRITGHGTRRNKTERDCPMKVVYNWLKEFVDVTASPAEVASRLALSGTNIGSVENGTHGAVIDAEVGSNRPDCLGHYGIARELGAVYKLPLKPVAPKPAGGATKASEAVNVEIQSPELCGRFTARVIRGAKIQPVSEMVEGSPRS